MAHPKNASIATSLASYTKISCLQNGLTSIHNIFLSTCHTNSK